MLSINSKTIHIWYLKQLYSKPALKTITIISFARIQLHSQSSRRVFNKSNDDNNFLGMYFDGENYLQFGDFKSDMDDKVIEIISTSKTTAEAAADWDAWLETMKPKIQLILDELEASDVPKINSY